MPYNYQTGQWDSSLPFVETRPTKKEVLDEIVELQEFISYFWDKIGPRNVERAEERLAKIKAYID